VLRRIFGSKRDGIIGEWRQLHNQDFYNFYSSLNIIRIIKSWRMRWAGHVAGMGQTRNPCRVWWESLEKRGH
jgi:hypothetical protein